MRKNLSCRSKGISCQQEQKHLFLHIFYVQTNVESKPHTIIKKITIVPAFAYTITYFFTVALGMIMKSLKYQFLISVSNYFLFARRKKKKEHFNPPYIDCGKFTTKTTQWILLQIRRDQYFNFKSFYFYFQISWYIIE